MQLRDNPHRRSRTRAARRVTSAETQTLCHTTGSSDGVPGSSRSCAARRTPSARPAGLDEIGSGSARNTTARRTSSSACAMRSVQCASARWAAPCERKDGDSDARPRVRRTASARAAGAAAAAADREPAREKFSDRIHRHRLRPDRRGAHPHQAVRPEELGSSSMVPFNTLLSPARSPSQHVFGPQVVLDVALAHSVSCSQGSGRCRLCWLESGLQSARQQVDLADEVRDERRRRLAVDLQRRADLLDARRRSSRRCGPRPTAPLPDRA
jgi:hypothetical protein